jgi:thiol:disulfide interchange protein
MKKVPNSLRIWFIIHFIADIIFGIPLLITPYWFLNLLGYTVEPLTARLVGAALIGIGGTSLLIKDKSLEQFKALLTLKVVWSLSAIFGIILTLTEQTPKFTWLILITFVIFSSICISFSKNLS